MKKLVFVALAIFAFSFAVNAYSGELFVPETSVNLNESVQVDPDLVGLIPVSALENIKWHVRSGENLWTIARRYAEYKGVRYLNRYINEVVELNKDNRCVKSRDLVLANCVINIPAYRAAQVRVQSSVNKEIFEAEKQKATEVQKSFDSYKRGSLVAIVALIVILIVLVAASTSSSIEQNRFVADLKQKTQGLEKKLWEAEDNLKIADEKIRLQRKENNRLVETLSRLYIDKDALGVNLAEARATLEGYAKCAKGALYPFESRDNGVIHGAYRVKKSHIGLDGKPMVDLLECASEGCGAEVLPNNTNCNSHYWKQHGTSLDAKPDGFKE